MRWFTPFWWYEALAGCPAPTAFARLDQSAELGAGAVESLGALIHQSASDLMRATFPGLGAYCMSKHASHECSECLWHHLAPELEVAELIPGEVDTGMQASLRELDPADFPLASFFRGNRANLIPADLAAQICHWLLTHTTTATFNRSEPWFSASAFLAG